MAKKSAALGIGIAAAVAAGVYMLTRSASAAEGGDDFDEPLGPGEGPGQVPGSGPGGSPKPASGGKVYGSPPAGTTYTIPADWDPIRGLWISPDCEMVVEAPGWFCGSDGDITPWVFGAGQCNAVEFDNYADTMADPGNGVAGYVEFLINMGMFPDEIAGTIVGEAVPEACWSLPVEQWPDGLWAWWEGFLARVTAWWEEAWGIPFNPEGEAA